MLAGVAAAICAAIFGGWEWALACSIVLLVVMRGKPGLSGVLYTVAPGCFWLTLFCVTGDRRMFFPYSMQYAIQMACLLHGGVLRKTILGGGGVVSVFALIRAGQEASAKVLVVELVVAAVVLALAMAGEGLKMREPRARAVAAAFGR